MPDDQGGGNMAIPLPWTACPLADTATLRFGLGCTRARPSDGLALDTAVEDGMVAFYKVFPIPLEHCGEWRREARKSSVSIPWLFHVRSFSSLAGFAEGVLHEAGGSFGGIGNVLRAEGVTL